MIDPLTEVMRIVEDGLAEIGWVRQSGWCGWCGSSLLNEFWYCPKCRDRKTVDPDARLVLPLEEQGRPTFYWPQRR